MPLITIATVNVPGWQGNADVQLRINTLKPFTAESGTIYPQTVKGSLAGLGTFYQAYSCSVASGDLVIPEVIIDSTEDSPDNSSATYSAELWDISSGKFIQSFGTFKSFPLSPSPTSTTWQAIFAAEAL